jgi:predicted RNA-binding Zn-ribbon protein involved in translation (DUF1610 family)
VSRGKRPSVRRGRELPKRATCPECGKKGVGTMKPACGVLIRECQYCRAVFRVVGGFHGGRMLVEQLTVEGSALPLRANDPRSDNSACTAARESQP